MSRLRVGRILMLLAVVGMAGFVGWWAGREALVAPEDPLAEPEPVSYTVVEGVVDHSLSFVAVAEWEPALLARSEVAGVVTSVSVEPGGEVSAGDVLFAADLRPVVAAAGQTPAFREMSLRDSGNDVGQLQGLLMGLGFLVARSMVCSGRVRRRR
jgi:multidrug efflux pump subunit AcrA (membrane-fusion protein)